MLPATKLAKNASGIRFIDWLADDFTIQPAHCVGREHYPGLKFCCHRGGLEPRKLLNKGARIFTAFAVRFVDVRRLHVESEAGSSQKIAASRGSACQNQAERERACHLSRTPRNTVR